MIKRIKLWLIDRRCRKLREKIWEEEDFLMGMQLFLSTVKGGLFGRPDAVNRVLEKLDDELMRCVEEKYRLIET